MESSAPMNTEPTSDLQPAVDDRETPKLPEPQVTIAYLPPSKPSALAPLTPSSDLSGKRKRLKSVRLNFTSINLEKKRSMSKDQAVKDPTRTLFRFTKKKATKDSKAPVQISQTMIRAREFQLTLGNEHPTFLKAMVKSHVTICFWMGLPGPFCRSYLPRQDSWIVIEDENGEQSKLNFIADRSGLSAGWRKFAIGHKLREGDVLIFQLVDSCKFKVYVVRANDSKEVDDAVNVITQDAQPDNITMTTVKTYSKTEEKGCSIPLPLTKVKRKYTRSKPSTPLSIHHTDPSVVNSQVQGDPLDPALSLKEFNSSSPPTTKVKRKYTRSKPSTPLSTHHTDPSVVNSQELNSSSLPATKVKRKYRRSIAPTQLISHHTDPPVVNSQVQGGPADPTPSLKELKTFKDFHIIVDKQCIDSELSGEIRIDYYNLCVEKNEILHIGVREGLYYKLVAGVIGETVNIAKKLRNCKITTRKEEFDAWDSSLESFELIGMKVGFLRDRIRALASHEFESEDAKRYVEMKAERNRNANEITVMEAKLLELYESNRKIDGVLDGLKEKAEKYETEFQRKVDEPW